MTAGYSGTPLVKKLGIKPGFRVTFVNAPADYILLPDLPPDITHVDLASAVGRCDFVQGFYTQRAALENEFPALKSVMDKNGMLWISWAKAASKLPARFCSDPIPQCALSGTPCSKITGLPVPVSLTGVVTP